MTEREKSDLFKSVFLTPQGERVLEKICVDGFVFRSTGVAGDACQTAMNEGSRRLALGILRLVHRTPKQQQQFAANHIERETVSGPGIRVEST